MKLIFRNIVKNRILPVLIMLGFSLTVMVHGNNALAGDRSLIREALLHQVESYPYSHYRDIYKNFMQDFFGPGHLIVDTVASDVYLKNEIAETRVFEGPDFEYTGYNGNFVRVNLGLIADETIPYDVFFKTFIRSVGSIVAPEPEEWLDTWRKIDEEISDLGLQFEEGEEDRQFLKAEFEKGNFIVHHSDAFNDNSNFHYRIVSREEFERTLRPYLREGK